MDYDAASDNAGDNADGDGSRGLIGLGLGWPHQKNIF